jgi:hypothetical protein
MSNAEQLRQTAIWMMAFAIVYGRADNELAEILVAKAGRYLDEAATLPVAEVTQPSSQLS